MMKSNILELGLKAILEEQRETLTDSLLAAGIDVESGTWNHAKVIRNAQRSIAILLAEGEREGNQYLRIILDGLKRKNIFQPWHTSILCPSAIMASRLWGSSSTPLMKSCSENIAPV